MRPIDIIVIVVVAVLVIAALIYLALRKLKGKGGCDCGGNCSACGMCKTEKEEHKDEQSCPHCNGHNE